MREELLRKARTGKISWLIILPFIFCSFLAFGEGTKEVAPNSSNPYYLEINRSGGQSIPFAIYTPRNGFSDPVSVTYQAGTSSVDYRLNIKICNAGEIMKFGF